MFHFTDLSPRSILSALAHCKLCRQLTGAVFVAILIVEAVILMFSVQNFEQDRLLEVERVGLSVVRTKFQLSENIHDSLKMISPGFGEGSVLVRARIFDLTGQELATFEQRNHVIPDDQIFQVSWGPDDLGYPFRVRAELDQSEVPDQIAGFIWRIIGLVLIISIFVTGVSMAMVGKFVLTPIRQMRAKMIRASEDPSHPEKHQFETFPQNELGDVAKAFNTLLNRLCGAFGEIHAQQATLIDNNSKLEKEVSKRTTELQKMVRDLRREASERERAERALDATKEGISSEHLRRLAYTDTLTGLANRDLFNDRAAQALHQLTRKSSQAALHLINLKKFKSINETFGAHGGDEVLQVMAERLKCLVRDSDTLARLSADEFALIQLDITKADEASILAQRIIERIGEPLEINDEKIDLQVAIGIAFLPDDGVTLESAMKHVTLAQRKAAQDVRSSYHFYVEEMDQQALERQSLERDLAKALPNGELEVYFQPKLDLKSAETRATEALLRWHHPERGFVSPGVFIPIAEGSALIVKIGEWVLRQAVRTAKRWQNDGLGSFKVAVNLSAAQLRETCMVTTVRQILLESHLDPEYLELEITETAVMEDVEKTIQTLHELRALGVSISIDDFGTGYSSLNYLHRFPAQRIKIDKAFIDEITDETSDGVIARAVITMGHSLGMDVTAEGVEHPGQRAFLEAMGCDEMQGYLFARPMSAGQFEEFIKSRPEEALAAE